jgi:hypothetical protein
MVGHMNDRTTTPPIVCDMTDAPDTAAERIAAYERLFAQTLICRRRTDTGIQFRFRADPGVVDWVRDLAAREKACCTWADSDITVQDGEVWWDWRAPEDDVAQQILHDFYDLPDTIIAGPDAILDQIADKGQYVMVRDEGTLRPATPAELGLV